MAITIAGITWDGFKNRGDQPAPVLVSAVEVESRHGFDGHATRPIGTRSEPITRRPFKDFASAAAAQTQLDNLLAELGETANFIDEFAVTTTNVLLEKVSGISKVAIISGANTHRAECDVTLRKVA